jgi:hypothetical protein
MSSPSATRDRYPYQNEPLWSRPEKAIARTVFDAALKRELHEIMQEARRKANQISKADDLWDLERYLTQHRKDIDAKYEFRSSRLTRVFGRLLSEGRVSEEELSGLGEDKLKVVRSCAKVLSEDAA